MSYEHEKDETNLANDDKSQEKASDAVQGGQAVDSQIPQEAPDTGRNRLAELEQAALAAQAAQAAQAAAQQAAQQMSQQIAQQTAQHAAFTEQSAHAPQQSQQPQPYRGYAPGHIHSEQQSYNDQRIWAAEWSLHRRGESPPEEWREPMYSQPHESATPMYTPSPCAAPPYPHTRAAEAVPIPVKEKKKSSGRFGRFVRAVCLVIICVSLSTAAAYGVMEFRLSRGDFDIVNHVVLGNTPGSQDGVPGPLASGEAMTASDIYDMALTQVVGIVIEMPPLPGMPAAPGSNQVSGSGFIISVDGYIITNYHVIEPAQDNGVPITIVLNGGIEFVAEIIGYDRGNDIALLKINATGLNPVTFANSDDIRVGETVYAVGNPFGELVYTMTDGIISALDRVVTVDRRSINTFQFSAAVNSGNSGGPLYSANGEVIGIVTAKIMRGSVEGIGFAVPINDAIEVAMGLIEHGYIAGRPFIGITAQTVLSNHAEYYDWVVGARVRSVLPDSAAETAGLQPGDIIIRLDDTEIDSMETLVFALRSYNAGDYAVITVWRYGEVLNLPVTFDEDMSAGRPQR